MVFFFKRQEVLLMTQALEDKIRALVQGKSFRHGPRGAEIGMLTIVEKKQSSTNEGAYYSKVLISGSEFLMIWATKSP